MNETTNGTAQQHATKNAAQQLREHFGVSDKGLPAYLRPAPSAEYVGIGLSTLWRYAANRGKTGFPQAIKLSDRVTVFKRADLDAWVQSRNAERGAA